MKKTDPKKAVPNPPKKPLSRPEKVPPGWYSRSDLEKAWNLGQAQTGTLLAAATERREVEVRMFRVLRLTGLKKVPHYRFKP